MHIMEKQWELRLWKKKTYNIFFLVIANSGHSSRDLSYCNVEVFRDLQLSSNGRREWTLTRRQEKLEKRLWFTLMEHANGAAQAESRPCARTGESPILVIHSWQETGHLSATAVESTMRDKIRDSQEFSMPV